MFTNATKDAANETISNASKTLGNAKSTAYSAKRDIENEADHANRDAGNLVNRFANDVENVANNAGRKARNLVDSANDQFNETTDMVTSRIRNNPIGSSALALGLGFVIGALFRRS